VKLRLDSSRLTTGEAAMRWRSTRLLYRCYQVYPGMLIQEPSSIATAPIAATSDRIKDLKLNPCCTRPWHVLWTAWRRRRLGCLQRPLTRSCACWESRNINSSSGTPSLGLQQAQPHNDSKSMSGGLLGHSTKALPRKSGPCDSKEIANAANLVDPLTLSALSVNEARRRICRKVRKTNDG
jgi:hypothetical protein